MRNAIGLMSIFMIIFGAIFWGWFVFHGEYHTAKQLIGITMICAGGCAFVAAD